MHVHPVLPWNLKLQQPQLLRSEPDEQPTESSQLARTHTGDAVNRLVFWMKSDDPRASVAASNSLLDRGYGKPVAPIELDHHVGEFQGLEYHDVMRAIADKPRPWACGSTLMNRIG
jgi:hypothetical protein